MSIAPEHYALIAMAICGLLVAGLWFRRHFFALIAPDEQEPAKEASRPSPKGLDDELFRFRVELHEMARDIKGELDTKIAVLHRLVILAKEETARLEAALEQTRRREAA